MDQRRSLVYATLGLLLLLLGSIGGEAQVLGSIQPLVMEEVVDLDGDGFYDELRFHVTLAIEIAGTYHLGGFLRNSTGHQFFDVSAREEFPRGSNLVTLAFPGSVIYYMGEGPYRLFLRLDAVDMGRFIPLDTYETETAPYASGDFEPPLVELRFPFAEEARDTDGNGLWDELAVRAGLTARGGITVRVSGVIHLDVRYGLGRIFSKPVEAQLEPGEAEVELVFPGYVFYAYGQDGPYLLSIRLAAEGHHFPTIPFLQRTAAYRADDFERTSIDFQGPPQSRLVDTDRNRRADVLLLEVPLWVRQAGVYTLVGRFMEPCIPSCPWHSVGRNVHLEPGNQTVVLTVGGVNLHRAPADGPWSILFSVTRRDGSPDDFRAMEWSTPPLNRSAFESPQPVLLRATVSTPDGRSLSHAHAEIYDPERKFHATAFTWGDELELTLYEGSFTLILSASTPDPYSEIYRGAFRVVLRNEAKQSLVLSPASQSLEAYNLTFRGWSEADAMVVRTLRSRAPWIRSMADFYGDFDGNASTAELVFCADCPVPPLVDVEVDGTPLFAVRNTQRVLSGAGAYAQLAPLVMADTFVFRSESPLGESVPDSVIFRMPYDWEEQDLTLRIQLPGPDLTLFRTSPNVTVRSVNPTNWEVDPGTWPADNDQFVQPEVVVEFRPSRALTPAERGLLVLAGVIPAGLVAYYITRRSRHREEVAEPRE